MPWRDYILTVFLLIDCDPGLDDAVAIALAAASPAITLEAITTVAGNAGIDMVTRNALSVCEALGLEAPVYRGSARALEVEPRTSAMLWGGDGDLGLPEARSGDSGDAVEHLARILALAPPGSLTLCPIGPMTNIARAIGREPAAARGLGHVVAMGGALGKGNATPHAELNIWVDPHAAARVFEADLPLTLIPLDLTRRVVAGASHLEALRGASGRAAGLCARLLPMAGENSHPSSIHDACAVGYLLWPELFHVDEGEITVVTEGSEEGRTRFRRVAGGRHRVAVGLNVEPFLERLVATLATGQ